MKKILVTFMSVLLLFGLAACGDTGGSTEDSTSEGDTTNLETSEEKDDNKEVSETTFDNGDYVYDIKEIEQIEGQYDTDVLAIEMEFTNNTDEPEDPWMSLGISAYQETENTIESLDGANGLYPEDYKPELVKMGDSKIKPGKTVEAVIGFEIEFPGSDVTLKDYGAEEGELFETVVKTEE